MGSVWTEINTGSWSKPVKAVWALRRAATRPKTHTEKTSPGIVTLFLNEREGKTLARHWKSFEGYKQLWSIPAAVWENHKQTGRKKMTEVPGTGVRVSKDGEKTTALRLPPLLLQLCRLPVGSYPRVAKRRSFCCCALGSELWPWPPSPPSRPCSSPTRERAPAPQTGCRLIAAMDTWCWEGKLEARSLNTEEDFQVKCE